VCKACVLSLRFIPPVHLAGNVAIRVKYCAISCQVHPHWPGDLRTSSIPFFANAAVNNFCYFVCLHLGWRPLIFSPDLWIALVICAHISGYITKTLHLCCLYLCLFISHNPCLTSIYNCWYHNFLCNFSCDSNLSFPFMAVLIFNGFENQIEIFITRWRVILVAPLL
jgi:hypothetical protein